MRKPPKPCTRCGKEAVEGKSKCRKHLAQDRARTDNHRGTAAQRGYDHTHSTRFRDGVFDRHGDLCVAPRDGEPQSKCGLRATHADHYPLSRRQLVARGLDPNDPEHGRPLCEHHHNQHTGKTQGRLAKRRDEQT